MLGCLAAPNLFKNLLLWAFSSWAVFPEIFQRENGPLRYSGKRPIKVGKRPAREAKRPINATGLFSGTLPWSKVAPLEGPLSYPEDAIHKKKEKMGDPSFGSRVGFKNMGIVGHLYKKGGSPFFCPFFRDDFHS